ncbi:MAG: vanadium-dependent haloperoxidase [Candidatus Acidiferrales bacterium]
MGWKGPRRAFLSRLGKATAVGLSTSKLGIRAWASGKDVEPLSKNRTQESFNIREECAAKERHAGTPAQTPNGDEDSCRSLIGNYSKGLPHNSIGEVDPSSYHVFLEALKVGTAAAFEDVPIGGSAKLVNPLAGMAFDLEGADSHQLACAPAPSVSSQVRADEMIELYWMALCRDVNFSEFASSPTALAAAAEMSSLGGFQGPKARNSVTAQTLFRGYTQDDLIGPYVSQLFQIPFNYGQFFLSGQASTYFPDTDYLTTQAKWLECQNGQGQFSPNAIDPQPRYYRNGRDLAAYVHFDQICEVFYNAALRLFEAGAPANPRNPYLGLRKQAAFATFGEPHFLTMHGEFALRALKAVWYAKWFVHRTLRPEAYGGLVQMMKTRQANYPIHADVLNARALEQTAAKFGSYFFSSAYPEGCPLHPSYPQAHACVAGACATFLKAAFDGSVQFNTLRPIQIASEDGLSLIPYTESDANLMTVNGEINKLASNIGMARNFAGVHWRSDYSEGLKLGEAVAISILREQKPLYHRENFSGFAFTDFDGQTITLS